MEPYWKPILTKIKKSYQVVLLTDKNKIPLWWWDSDDKLEKYEALANRINAFIDNRTETRLTVEQDDQDLGSAFAFLGVFLLFISLLFAGIATTINCIFEQESNSFILRRQRFFGLKNSSAQLALSDINDAVLECAEGETTGTSRITLTLKTGEKFPLTRIYSSGEKREIAATIKNFIESYKSQQKSSAQST